MCDYEMLSRLRRDIPSFECAPGCHDCCGPVTASSLEIAKLPVKSDAAHQTALDQLSCPYLGATGCEVYDERPLICRLFGTTSSLPCPNGRQPDVMIDSRSEQRIYWFARHTRQVLI